MYALLINDYNRITLIEEPIHVTYASASYKEPCVEVL